MVPAEIVQALSAAGGKCFEVGGCVRDRLLGVESKDIDVEVFGLEASVMANVLKSFGRVSEVGVSFGVIKLRTNDGNKFDFALPRRENKTGRGHRGFQVEVDHTLTPEVAASRRDFTINAISRCLETFEFVDPLGGQEDLRRGLLRATGPKFAEDPLRVLRGMQFAARFDMKMTDETIALSQDLLDEFSTLSTERVWGEWQKWALRSKQPSKGLQVLKQTHWLKHFPELVDLVGVPQDSRWHPEGDVWIHTLHVCDEAVAIANRDSLADEDRVVLMFAALCHDLGKAVTTAKVDGRWRAHGHCKAGVPLTRSFLGRIGCPPGLIEQVEPLVAEHLAHATTEISVRFVRRLSCRLGKSSIDQLLRLIEADVKGRPPLPKTVPESARRISELAVESGVQSTPPKPLVSGRHLIELGFKPDKWFGEVLKQCFEAQLDGAIVREEDGIVFLQELLQNRDRPSP